jgi:hypothetical protein
VRVWGAVSKWTSCNVHMEPLFHGLIWELECCELAIELWLWFEDWFTGASMASGRALATSVLPLPDLPLAASSPGLAETLERIFLLAPSKAVHWLPNMCSWFGHLGLRPSVRWALLGWVFLSPTAHVHGFQLSPYLILLQDPNLQGSFQL